MASYRVHNYRLQLERKSLLEKKIRNSRKSGGSLELIVEVESRKRDKAYASLSKVGKITHAFEFIPYLSFECDAKDAEGIVGNKSKGYVELRKLVNGVEASAEFTVPKPSSVKLRRPGLSSFIWNLKNIGAYEARNYSCGEGVKIAVIDTGVDYNHPEVSGNFEKNKGYDFVNNNDNPMDRNGHGTHVAGVCVGQEYGIATDSWLYAVRVLDENGSGSESNVIAGIEWALKNDIDVANLSLGSPVASSAFESICYRAYEDGLVIVAAAGNNGGEYAMYPAAFGEPVIAVAAVDRYNNHADFSNICITNDVSAPGVGIVSSYLNGSYATLDGTSMATPHVSGSVALAIPLLKGSDIFSLVDETAERIGDGSRDVFGAGLVRADRMVNELNGNGSLLEMVKRIVW